jgi:hypothetical protein
MIVPESAAPVSEHHHAERMGGVGAVLSVQLEEARRAGEKGQSAILVEGVSDQRAIEALGRRYGRIYGPMASSSSPWRVPPTPAGS